MLNILNLMLSGFLMNILGQPPKSLDPIPLVSWETSTIFDLPTQSDPTVEAMVKSYLKNLSALGLGSQNQRVWLETEWAELANQGGTVPTSAASLTKVATTLASIETWPLDHRFETRIYHTGNLVNGLIEGDLIVEGTGDPMFVWEEAIAVAHALTKAGIRQVKGNLIITGQFAMNFKTDPQIAGELFKQGINSNQWSSVVESQYAKLPNGTIRPQIAIARKVLTTAQLPKNAKLLLRHQSLTLAELLKQMNLYSNNVMSEMLAELVGGHEVVRQIMIKTAKVSPDEIQLVNGSGLSVDNRISPRAVCQIFQALEQKLGTKQMSVTDLFPVGGRDKDGTIHQRQIPYGVAIKTGTLAQVSALAGMIPTKERGKVWFAILNSGGNIDGFRHQQDQLLKQLSNHWELTPTLTPISPVSQVFLGDPNRNINVQN
ncbi:D-alanyl-D-alanine carboxypeptidase [Aphanothece hegewaldii CCALA 016]|uniref:D-alanyl-D-alanine carboxypeptidase n=1 Tax=Aphanothece hegewaldii CCALA 016 TaxID=2107694 RepID=A0A2T1M2F7_9CHRO|nr:D-alanyl-D-alanine carboxypeptidase [Aphanothece hegewaldii]PSF38929.1 D-alanyl-D-alanine carboxypeptidase [Aphanothece hegewaldii CCALA 016]